MYLNRCEVLKAEVNNNQVVLQEGYVADDGRRLYFRPNRGSGGWRMYDNVKTLEQFGRGVQYERPVKGKLVFIIDSALQPLSGKPVVGTASSGSIGMRY